MLGVDKGRHAPLLLGFGNYLKSYGGLAARFRAEYFDDPSAREATDAQRRVKGNRTSGNDCERNNGFFASQPHDGAFAELLFNLGKGQFNSFIFFRSLVSHIVVPGTRTGRPCSS